LTKECDTISEEIEYMKGKIQELEDRISKLEKGKNIVNKNEIDELSESVQEFYNSPCFRIKLKEFDEQKLDEVVETLKAAHEYYL